MRESRLRKLLAYFWGPIPWVGPPPRYFWSTASRDVETDRSAGRRTLVIALGRPVAGYLYAVLLSSVLLISAGPVMARAPVGWGLLPLLMLPWAFVLFRVLWRRTDGDNLNRLLISLGALLSGGLR